MDRKELEVRIQKKEGDIAKIQKRIAKWSKGLRPEDIAACEPLGNCTYGTVPRGQMWSEYHGTPEYQTAITTYRDYLKTHNDIPRNEEWNKGPNIDELHTAYIDLGDARATLQKYQIELTKLDNFDNAEKITVLWEFLCQWEKKAQEWYARNANRLFELKKSYAEERNKVFTAWKEDHPEPGFGVQYAAWERAKNRWMDSWTKDYYHEIQALTVKFTSFKLIDGELHVSFDAEGIGKIIAEEKVRKYKDLVTRVTDVVGEINDASCLSIGAQNGEIDGIISGTKGKAKVETISAGGYNIQCFHYRVLVHIL